MRRIVLGGLTLALFALVVTAAYAALSAPAPQTPNSGVSVQSFPEITWSTVRGAAIYEYQIAADPRFQSIVQGTGTGKGDAQTHSTAATLDQAIPDGTYYWHVRAIDAKDTPGPWSRTRKIVKHWSTAPKILAPANGATVAWPTMPLVLSWSSVPYATGYLVTIATDPALSNAVVGTATSPVTTQGTQYALPTSLAPGQYYWAVTPQDAEGHSGTRSQIASFTWQWPTTMTTQVTNIDPNPQVFDPQFSWTPVPGAAHYEVEVNSAQDFPAGSKWCCTGQTTGTSLTPTQVLGNSTYYWRVRAIDSQGNAGVWNVGSPFTKAFDSAPPTIPSLTMSNVNGSALSGSPVSTDTPIVTWAPVPGASRYELQLANYTSSACDWSTPSTYETATTAWTPLGNPSGHHVGPTAWPNPQSDNGLTVNDTYCVRVLARSDNDALGNQVVSDWTQLGGSDMPAFTYLAQPASGSPGQTPASAYIAPAPGSTTPRTPLFTWNRVAGAGGYYVVISRDAGFTQVADVAFTNIPAYAPRLANQEPLADATSGYYWAIIPSAGADGSVVTTNPPTDDAPQTFTKSSTPPNVLAPINGAIVAAQPTFSWTPAENARNYTLQVSEDPSFGNPIDNVSTDATAYTSSSTYPADTVLYWRVRANDWNGQGLNWSPTATFQRTLPSPVPSSGNPTRATGLPDLSWAPVQGAISYDVHIEQQDGSTHDFNVASTSFTPTLFYGLGVWHWQVRAEFPVANFGNVAGGYSPLQAFVRTLGPPSGVHGVKSGTRIVISWQPDIAAKQYEVDIASTSGFATELDSHRVDGSSWSPNIDFTQPTAKGTLYWRVAAVDAGNNVGAFAIGKFTPPHAARCVASKATRTHKKVTCPKPKPKPKPAVTKKTH